MRSTPPQSQLDKALNVPPGWRVDKVDVVEGVVVASVTVEHRPITRCECQELPRWQANGRKDHIYRGLPVGGRPVLLRATYRRYRCARCRVYSTPKLPLGSVTPEFGRLLGEQALLRTVSAISREHAIGREVVDRFYKIVVAERHAQRQVLPPTILGLDDTQIAGRRRAVLVDVPRGKHIDILPKYGAQDVADFLAQHRETWRDTLQCVVIDPYPAYRLAVLWAFPEMPIVLDRFHVARPINQAVTQYMEAYRRRHRKLQSTRFLRFPQHPDYAKRVKALGAEHAHLAEYHAYAQEWQTIYTEAENGAEARYLWQQWRERMPDDLRPFLNETVGYLSHEWLTEICAAVDLRSPDGKVPTNGMTEAMHTRTGLWEMLTGYSSFEAVRDRVLLLPSREETEASRADWQQRLAVAEQFLRSA